MVKSKVVLDLFRSVDVACVDERGEDVVVLANLLVANRLRPNKLETSGGGVDPGVEPVRARNLDREALGVSEVRGAAVSLL